MNEQGSPLSSSGHESNSTHIQTITFEVNDQTFGINVLYLDEIVPLLEIKPIPKGPEFLKGLVNLRGDIVPIIDLIVQFGYERESYTMESRIIITPLRGKKVGYIVDGAKDIMTIAQHQIQPSVVNSEQSAFIEGIAKQEGGEMIHLVNPQKILDAEGIKQLFEMKVA